MMNETTKKDDSCMRGYGITHALNTCTCNTCEATNQRKLQLGLPLSDLRVIIDWFSSTFNKDYYNVDFIIHLLNKYINFPYFENFDEKINFYHEDSKHLLKQSPYLHNVFLESGYKQSISYGNISIFYDSYGTEKGYKLNISGQGCREFELMLNDDLTWLDFFREIVSLETNVTRLDLAIDDFSGYLPIQKVKKHLEKGRFVSRLRQWSPIDEMYISDGRYIQEGIQIGSRKRRSRILFRLYNKALEQNENFYWNRLEAEIKNENALNAINQILLQEDEETAISKVAMGITNQYIRICELEQTDSNKSRWTTWENWEKFIKNAEKVKIGISIPDNNIDTKLDWLQRQPPKSLALVMMYLAGKTELTEEDIDDNLGFLVSLIYNGLDKLQEKDIKLVEQALNINKKASLHNIDSLLNDDKLNLDDYKQIKNLL